MGTYVEPDTGTGMFILVMIMWAVARFAQWRNERRDRQ